MRVLRLDRLVITDPKFLRDLLHDLADCKKEMFADAPELEQGATVTISDVQAAHFTVVTKSLPNDVFALPMSSWRLRIPLTGAEFCLTTASLARTDTFAFGLAIPDEIVSGAGRKHYRVLVEPSENFQVQVIGNSKQMVASVVDASFGGARLKIEPGHLDPMPLDQEYQLVGHHHGIGFQETIKICWQESDLLGVTIQQDPDGTIIESTDWSHVVRRLAYDGFIKQTLIAA